MQIEDKFKTIYLHLLIVFLFIHNSSQTTLICKFGIVGWDTILKTPYACEVKSLNVTSRILITRIEGHQSLITSAHSNVNALQIRDQICEIFPRGIDKFFTNLEGIAVQRSKLKIVTKNDLKPFTKLKSLSLFGNHLKSLEFGLFKYNPNIELISFFDNRLEHIAEDLLDGMTQLKFAYFTNCNCINFSDDNLRNFVMLKANLRANCSSTIEMRNFYELEAKNDRTERNFNALVRKYKQKSSEARILNVEMKRLENLSNSTENNCKINDEMSLKLEFCEEKLKTFHLDVDEVEVVCDHFNGNLCIVEDMMVMNDHTRLVGAKTVDNIMKRENLVQISEQFNGNSTNLWTNWNEKENFEEISSDVVQNQEKQNTTKLHTILHTINVSFDNPTNTTKIIETQKVTTKFGDLYFTDSEKVQELWIVSHNLHFLPINIGEFFPNLKDLRIMKSKITKISAKSMTNLEKLEVLMMPKNEIVDVEEKAFEDLQNLKVLDLSDNEIDSLCKHVKVDKINLKSHEVYDQNHQFYPTENDYVDLDDEVSSIHSQNQHENCRNFNTFSPLINLREINLQGNKISYINWKVFENNKNLEIVNLKNNKISEIGSNFGLQAIKVLDLSENNCIDATYPVMSQNMMMEVFDTNCSVGVTLKCIFEDHFGDYSCRAIDLTIDSENTIFTQVSGIHQLLMTNGDVKKLIIADQNTKFFPSVHTILPNVTKLEIISSKLTKVPKLLDFETVEITANDIPKIDENVFDYSPKIEAIDLSNNKISSIPQNLFAFLMDLKYLNISSNQLTTLTANFISPQNSIEEFFVKNNMLTKIDSDIVKFLARANIIEFSGNICVDNKFYRAADNEKKIMEIFGEIEFKCK